MGHYRVVDPGSVDVVLVRPSRAANVAAACRAMKNMGLRRLKLVGPPPGLADPAARALAYGAWDLLDAATVHDGLRSAIGPSTLVVGTSGRSSSDAWSPRRLAEEGGARAGDGRTSLVFGPESSGLRNDELALCHLVVHIPTDPAQPSLNLAQAVLLLAYEIRLAAADAAPALPASRASAGDLEEALRELREGLAGIGYLNLQNPDAVLTELRRWLARARPTPREVTLLRGLARQARWAARSIARLRRPSG
jgi:tRNA (cytidine32/uridine32-2'-O)-methyltransferase